MQILLAIASILLLFILLYQDFKERQFSAIVLFFLFLLFVFFNISSIGWKDYLVNVKINLVATVLIFLVLSIVISLKEQKPVNIFKTHFGLGDLLFYFAGCFLFSCVNFFLFFFMLTPLLVVIFISLLRILKRDFNQEIPLAGIQSGLLILVFTGHIFVDALKLNSDQLILQLIHV